ncbi:MAG: DUF2163 domain-containing protein [Candidatus Acidiferrales bacterium]
MKNFSAGLLAFLKGSAPYTRADLFQITLGNGQIIRAASGQFDITYSGNIYYSTLNGAWQRGAITSEAAFDLRANDMSLTVLAPAKVVFPGTTVSYMAAAQLGLFDAAKVQVWTAYWPLNQTPNAYVASWGVETKYVGYIKPNGEISRSKIEFEVADPLYLLNLPVPKHVIQASCRHTLYDLEEFAVYGTRSNCTLNPASFSMNNTVGASSTTQSINLGTNANKAAPAYSQGYLKMTSGQNSGLLFSIKTQNGLTNLLLSKAMPLLLAVGDTFTMYQGCDKSLATCTNVFANSIHFGGMPFVPSPETAI